MQQVSSMVLATQGSQATLVQQIHWVLLLAIPLAMQQQATLQPQDQPAIQVVIM